MKTEKKADEAAWERSDAVDHALRLLTLQFLSFLHALLAGTSLYALDDDRLSESNAVKELQFNALAFPFLFASLLDNVLQPVHIERIAMKRSKMIKLNGEPNAVRPSMKATDFGLFFFNHRLLLYRAEAPWSDSLRRSPEMKNTPPGR